MSRLFSDAECVAIVAAASGRKAGDSAAPVERSEAADGASGRQPSPRSVTRGESTPLPKSEQSAKVDWLNATFVGPDRYTPKVFISLLSRMFRRPLTGIEGRGMFGFERGIKLIAAVGSGQFPIGCLAYGGDSQKGRWMLQLTGSGCSVVRDWPKMARFLKALKARITRLDLAVDYLEGEYTVDDAVNMHKNGEFACSGRPPSSTVAGDWLDQVAGRTLYIGKAVNGKMLRVYEKGMQLGDPESDWVRFEVQLGNRDRVIPYDAMTRRDEFLAGCYPALQKMLDVASEAIPTSQAAGRVSLGHLMFHLKRSYGKLIKTVSSTLAVDAGELIEGIVVHGTPRRLTPSAVTSGLTWEQLLSQFDRVRT
jgi:phage replication initiation protein